MFEKFTTYMDFQVALNDELRDEVLRTRHQVYCEELNYEPVRPDGRESDTFDDYSDFCLIRHLSSGMVAGCVRLVTPVEKNQPLPLEVHCPGVIQHPDYQPGRFSYSSICEISRLAVPLHFRRRRNEESAEIFKPLNQLTDEELRIFPLISMALYLGAGSLGEQKGLEHCFVIMEPRLARSLRWAGIDFVQVGKPVELRGKRAPYYINAERFKSGLSAEVGSLFREIESRIRSSLRGMDNSSR